MNPLLHEHFPIDFAAIRAEHVRPAIAELLARAQAEQRALHDAPRTYRDVLGGLDRLGRDLDFAIGVVGHLESVATTPELRAAYNDVLAEVSAFHVQVWLDPKLWVAVREVAASPEAAELGGIERRHLEQVVRAFRRHGAELKADDRDLLAEIDRELADVTNHFAQAVLDATAAWHLDISDAARLEGLPESTLAMAAAAAAAAGVEGWRLKLQQPIVLAVLAYAHDRELRRVVWQAYNSRAAAGDYDNRERILKILRLRRAKARLLGYADFADYVLEERMAKSGAAAAAFVADLQARARPAFAAENAELEAFYRSEAGPDAPPLMPWDIAYWAERLKRARYDLDAEALRPYFELERVLSGMFEIAARLFGIRIEAVPPDAPDFPGAWHQDVRYYRVFARDGTMVGAFYADLFPREVKRGGAWMDTLIVGGPTDDGFAPHVGLIAANVSPPVAGRPSLLTHEEVETIFHEFGHLLHQLLSRVPIRAMAGTNVAWDFVELPSQMMENWCWERESLDLIARHVETGAPLDDDTFQRMRASRTFRGANAMLRQLGFAALDLALHREFDPEGTEDVLAFSRQVLQDFSPVPLPEDYAMLTSFSHLFAGPVAYAAGYYSYKWAEVLEADAFSRFAAAGVLDAEVGSAFAEIILARGDSADPAELYREFMGRDPDPEALLRRTGLV